MDYEEERASASSQEREMLIHGSNFGEESHDLTERGISVDLEHVKAHRTKKEKNDRSHFEKFVTEGNEKADELAKEGALLDEGVMAEARAKLCNRKREELYAALQYAASFHCLVEQWKDCEELKPKPKEKWIFFDKKSEETKHRTEWCAEANKYRCMRRGRGSKYMKMPAKCTGPKLFSKSVENGEGVMWEVMIWSEEWTDSESS